MSDKSTRSYGMRVLCAGLCVPLMVGLAGACTVSPAGGGGTNTGGGTAIPPAGGGTTTPIVPTTTTLVSQTFTAAPSIDFSPSGANKLVTVTVTADASGSRMTLQVTELSTGSVVAFYPNATTNGSQSTFTSNSNGVHTLQVIETGTGASIYTLVITEQ